MKNHSLIRGAAEFHIRVVYVKPASGDVWSENNGKIYSTSWQMDNTREVTIFWTINSVSEIPHRKH